MHQVVFTGKFRVDGPWLNQDVLMASCWQQVVSDNWKGRGLSSREMEKRVGEGKETITLAWVIIFSHREVNVSYKLKRK